LSTSKIDLDDSISDELIDLAAESIARRFPESSEALRRKLTHHLYREGLPALRRLESDILKFAGDASHAIYGSLFHVHYHAYNAMTLYCTIESIGSDIEHDINATIDCLSNGDIEGAREILARIRDVVHGKEEDTSSFPS